MRLRPPGQPAHTPRPQPSGRGHGFAPSGQRWPFNGPTACRPPRHDQPSTARWSVAPPSGSGWCDRPPGHSRRPPRWGHWSGQEGEVERLVGSGQHQGPQLTPAGLQRIQREKRGRRHPEARPRGWSIGTVGEGGEAIPGRPRQQGLGYCPGMGGGRGVDGRWHTALECRGKGLLPGTMAL
jgi:hypothetical protein